MESITIMLIVFVGIQGVLLLLLHPQHHLKHHPLHHHWSWSNVATHFVALVTKYVAFATPGWLRGLRKPTL